MPTKKKRPYKRKPPKPGFKQLPPIWNVPTELTLSLDEKYHKGKFKGYWKSKKEWLQHVNDNLPEAPPDKCKHEGDQVDLYDDEYAYKYCGECKTLRKV